MSALPFISPGVTTLLPAVLQALSAEGRARYVIEQTEKAATTRRQLTAANKALEALIKARDPRVTSNDLVVFMQSRAAEEALSKDLNKVYGEINKGIATLTSRGKTDEANALRAWINQVRGVGGVGVGLLLIGALVAIGAIALWVAVYNLTSPEKEAARQYGKAMNRYVEMTGNPPPAQSAGVSLGTGIGIAGVALLGLLGIAFLGRR